MAQASASPLPSLLKSLLPSPQSPRLPCRSPAAVFAAAYAAAAMAAVAVAQLFYTTIKRDLAIFRYVPSAHIAERLIFVNLPIRLPIHQGSTGPVPA